MSASELRAHLEEMRALGESYFQDYERIRTGDLSPMKRLIPSDDCRVWRSYPVEGQDPDVSWEEHGRGLGPIFAKCSNIHHENSTIHPFPGGFLYQTTYCFTTPDGREIKFPGALVWHIDGDGKFVQLHEYLPIENLGLLDLRK
jgi:hypothetical protein